MIYVKWDPWIACSKSTANSYCLTYSSTSEHKCVASSSAYSNSGKYLCNQTTYQLNPFACEVSDLDGKYGRLFLSNGNQTFIRTDVSFWEMKSSDLHAKSIVFHCGQSNDRAFCAPFNTSSYTAATSSISQTEKKRVVGVGKEEALNKIWSDSKMLHSIYTIYIYKVDSNVKASFEKLSKGSKIELNADGTYKVQLNLTSIKSSINCESVIYRIYNSWNDTNKETSYIGNEKCSRVVGRVYDPTATCLPNSDSKFCHHSPFLCNDTTYVYQCNSTANRYSCSPSDLSGKYGALHTLNLSRLYFSLNGVDDVMVPLNLLHYPNSKSIVLECASNNSILACAKLTFNVNSDDSSSSTVVIIIIIVFSIIGAIAVGVFIYLWCRKPAPANPRDEEENIPLHPRQQSL
ncbi:hypothetical protein RFI_17481 [Reticulomyxa filosa]|uniref:Uncharacterized protein n=1 Tax=Reticulomyxa filosa TaxID=46433 RepID=X6N1X7_RETFI|nr:hypothetical protein RFI_17481 [Reticulomyxa filosa]|eukprot:ETO19749.1 hypothetical protein RFI_17481 [Reticulomyxa filosa]